MTNTNDEINPESIDQNQIETKKDAWNSTEKISEKNTDNN